MNQPVDSADKRHHDAAAAVRDLQQASRFEQAAALLFTHVEGLIEHEGWSVARELLARFPAALFDSEPALLYIRGLVYAHADELHRADSYLQRARMFFKQGCDFANAVRCCLELARIYQRREDFRTAHLLLQETERLLQRVERGQMSAQFFYRLAELYPDIGRLRDGDRYAQRALSQFELRGDLAGQFKTLRLLAIIARQQGRYQEAGGYLEMAKGLFPVGDFTPAQHAFVLNSEAHLLWYKRQLPQALATAQTLAQHAAAHNITKQRVYAQTLIGNVHRAQGDYAAAEQAYHALRVLAVELNFERFLPWADANEGWLHVLRGEPERGRTLLQRALETPDKGQIVSFNVFLGVLNLLDERYAVADDLLLHSLAFYQQSGDPLSVHNIHLYRTLISLRRGRMEEAAACLRETLGWMAEQQLVYLPHWWHPALVAELCVWATARGVLPAVVERIWVAGVGEPGRAVAQRLAADDPPLQQAAAHLLTLLDTQASFDLSPVAEAPVRRALEELLANGQLRRDGFVRLQERLITAQRRRTANFSAVAVFGLYVHGTPREEIAERLGLSKASARNYITLIYQVFDLPRHQFKGTRARRRALCKLAQEEGFI